MGRHGARAPPVVLAERSPVNVGLDHGVDAAGVLRETWIRRAGDEDPGAVCQVGDPEPVQVSRVKPEEERLIMKN